MDVDTGTMHRRGAGEPETNKKRPPTSIPRQLLGHLRRWGPNGATHVVEINGERVGSVKTAWKYALDEAGIDHCTGHDLRHTAITWAMQNGVDKW